MTSEIDKQHITLLEKILQTCFLPELPEDCIDVENHYQEYTDNLTNQMSKILDTFNWLESNVYNSLKPFDQVEQAFRIDHARLITLLHEFGSYEIPLKRPVNFVEAANKLLKKIYSVKILSSDQDEEIFNYYRKTLDKDKWKTQYGAMHGFQHYLMMKETLQQPLISLSLAIGLSIHSHHDIYYKNLSTFIFDDIFEKSNSIFVTESNIHVVIYNAILNDIYKMEDEKFIYNISKCLYKCLKFNTDIKDTNTWSIVDDVVEVILRNIMLTNNISIVICFLNTINKIGILFDENGQEKEDNLKQLSDMHWNCKEYYNVFKNNSTFLIYRWAKRILEVLECVIAVCLQHLDTKNQLLIQRLLWVILNCYMVYLLPIPLTILEPHIKDFYNKFVKYLMEISSRKKEDVPIIQIITNILETFYYHHDCQSKINDKQSVCLSLENYKKSFYQLLLISPFKRCSTMMEMNGVMSLCK